MAWIDEEDGVTYDVIVSNEEQYSLWPAEETNPDGWSDFGIRGTKAECLTYIREHCLDPRPYSHRKLMEQKQ